MPVVREALNNVRAKWYDVGMQLQVSVGTLDAIKKQYSDPSDCLMETLKTWLKTFSSPSWSNIVDSLRSSVVGEVRLADYLKHKHCSTQNTSSAATRPVPPTLESAQPTTPQHLSPSPTPSAFSDHPTPPYNSAQENTRMNLLWLLYSVIVSY